MKTSKATMKAAAFLFLVGMGTAYFSPRAHGASSHATHHATQKLVIVGKNGVKHDFQVEIAATPEARDRGLMFRKKMAPNHGMLFEMNETAPVYFWMKNTLIPLDMLFIAPDGTITHIHANAIPEDETPISSDGPVGAVIELNGGRAKALGIVSGDKVLHPYFGDVK